MARQDTIKAMLAAFARNYSKRDDWPDAVWGTWYTALKEYSDDDVKRIARHVMSERGRIPTVAAFLEYMKGDPHTAKPEGPKGCPACEGTGWREVAWHRWADGRLLVTSYAAACDCALGHTYAMGAAEHWSDVVDAYSKHPSTEAVYATSASAPALTIEQRYHPDVVERLRGGSAR